MKDMITVLLLFIRILRIVKTMTQLLYSLLHMNCTWKVPTSEKHNKKINSNWSVYRAKESMEPFYLYKKFEYVYKSLSIFAGFMKMDRKMLYSN